MVKIWFNHWFSTAYDIIDLIKKADSNIYVLGSHEADFAAYKPVCDEWHKESDAGGDEYVDFCIDFCKKQGINIFAPRREMLAVSRRKAEFENIGVKVLADDPEITELFECKSKAYNAVKNITSINIPEYHIVDNASDFSEACKTLTEKYKSICFKFDVDEGGRSFRIIDDTKSGFNSLLWYRTARITFKETMEYLSERENFPPIIVMPYLPDAEISVDCLNTYSGRIIIPRLKGNTRCEKIFFDKDIVGMCSDFMDEFPLECPFNIQFKYLDGVPYFLEVNTRMSGGVQLACAAENINIPYIAAAKLLGKNVPWHIKGEERIVTNVEVPLVVK